MRSSVFLFNFVVILFDSLSSSFSLSFSLSVRTFYTTFHQFTAPTVCGSKFLCVDTQCQTVSLLLPLIQLFSPFTNVRLYSWTKILPEKNLLWDKSDITVLDIVLLHLAHMHSICLLLFKLYLLCFEISGRIFLLQNRLESKSINETIFF